MYFVTFSQIIKDFKGITMVAQINSRCDIRICIFPLYADQALVKSCDFGE